MYNHYGTIPFPSSKEIPPSLPHSKMFTLHHGVTRETVFKPNFCNELKAAFRSALDSDSDFKVFQRNQNPFFTFLLVAFQATFDPCFQAGDHAVTTKTSAKDIRKTTKTEPIN